MPDRHQHVLEARGFRGYGDALEHRHGGGNLQRLAIVIRIAARRQEPPEFKLAHPETPSKQPAGMSLELRTSPRRSPDPVAAGGDPPAQGLQIFANPAGARSPITI